MARSPELWGCSNCAEIMPIGEHCGCWVCHCCELQPLSTLDNVNLAGEPCWKCGHKQGACNCWLECAAGCGFLHPVGFLCNYQPGPVVALDDDDEIPF
jgi:hypothetical protein